MRKQIIRSTSHWVERHEYRSGVRSTHDTRVIAEGCEGAMLAVARTLGFQAPYWSSAEEGLVWGWSQGGSFLRIVDAPVPVEHEFWTQKRMEQEAQQLAAFLRQNADRIAVGEHASNEAQYERRESRWRSGKF
jgi:hypothetical protein